MILDVDPTNCIVDSIKKHTQELLGTPCPRILSTGPQASPLLCIPHPQTLLICYWISMQAAKCVKHEPKLWQISSENIQKAIMNLWARNRPQTWALAPPLGKQMTGYNYRHSVLKDQEKTHRPKYLATRRSKNHKADISIERLRKPQTPYQK